MIPPLAAIFAWPVVSAVLFQRMHVALAILITIIGGYLLLPEDTAIDLPLLPALDKANVPALACLVFLGFSKSVRSELKGLLPRHWIVRGCLLLLFGGAFITVLQNPDPLSYGNRTLSGLRPYDGFSAVLTVIMLMLPVILARRYLSTPVGHRMILLVLVVAGLWYTIPAIFEVRFSPQINRWVYGFFPHEWRQHVRADGGFRPVVFLGHGLLLSIFISGCVLAAVGVLRLTDAKYRQKWVFAVLWLFLVLVLSKSFGALVVTLALLPVALLAQPRLQLIIAAVIGIIILFYPAMRSANLVPTDRILSTVSLISDDRAASLETRLKNEDQMLEKVSGRAVFGWGGYGRSRIFDNRGRDLTIADGYWIIVLGVGGWARYIGEFGLLTVPLVLLFLRARDYKIGAETSVLALILAGNLIDMVPNSSITPLSWLIAGALWGRLEIGANVTIAETAADADSRRPLWSRGHLLPVNARQRDAGPPRLNPAAEESAAENSSLSPYTRQKKRLYRSS